MNLNKQDNVCISFQTSPLVLKNLLNFKKLKTMIKKHVIPYDGAFSTTYTKLSKEDSIQDGVVVSKSVYTEFSFVSELHNQNYQIFGMSNLIALGQMNNLKVGMFQASPLRDSDKIETKLNSLKNATKKTD